MGGEDWEGSTVGDFRRQIALRPWLRNRGQLSRSARPDNLKRAGEWKWKQNPFVGTPQLQGLKIMMALINNWDLKDANNVILKDGNELQYAISDLGATFGHASTTPLLWRFTRSRNNPVNYAKSDFFEKVKGDRVVLHFGGKNRGLMNNISEIGRASCR